jgi:hypothetical protein
MLKKSVVVVVGLLAVVAGAFSGGFVFGQGAAEQEFNTQLASVYAELSVVSYGASLLPNDADLRTKLYDVTNKLADVQDSAIGDSAKTRLLVKQTLSSYFVSPKKQDALVRLQAVQTLQNQRIIELLERREADKK